uniref:hypothetical protein n=1 Tax=Bacillus sp. JCM 19041 TaxID=1460637 RepID=UPI000B124D86
MLVPLLRLFVRLQKREFQAQTTAQKTSIIVLCVVFFFIGLFFANGFGYLAASTTNSFLLFSFQSLIVMLFIVLMMFTILMFLTSYTDQKIYTCCSLCHFQLE